MGYNEIMVAQAKSRVLRELGIDITPGKVLTFNGDTTGLEMTDDNAFAIFTPTWDLSTIAKVTISIEGEPITLTPSDEGFSEVIRNVDESSFLGKKATLVAMNPDDVYTTKVEFATTTTPIKPEYLPGVCLPVVEITSAEYPQSGIVVLSAEERERINNALGLSSLLIFKFKEALVGNPVMVPVIMSATLLEIDGSIGYIMVNESKDKIVLGYPAQNGDPGYWQMGAA